MTNSKPNLHTTESVDEGKATSPNNGGLSPNRTNLAIRNAVISVLCYFFPIFLGFFCRKYFLEILGAELLGLNNVVLNILNVLNTSELGLSAAIAFALYEPLYKGDRQTAVEIVTLQARIYRWIARFILISGAIILIFFPRIFAQVKLPLWYAYATFGALLVGTLLSYYFNYRQVLFSSDQRGYIPNLCININKSLKNVLQIVSLFICGDSNLTTGYLWWLGWEVFFAISQTVTLELLIRRRYPWLKLSSVPPKQLLKRYPQIVRRTKQLIFHRVSTTMLQQGVTLVVYGILNVVMVTVYNNYTTIYTGLTVLFSFVFGSLQGSIGNKIVECNQEHRGGAPVEAIFRRIYTFRNFLSTAVLLCLLLFTPSFIRLWVGEDMLMDTPSFLLSLLYMYMITNRTPDDFIAAYGMYQDIWAPVTEMFLNIGLSIFLGLLLGLPGILLGVIISLLLIVHTWKPYFLYRYGFKHSLSRYLSLLGHNLSLSSLSLFIGYLLLSPRGVLQSNNFSLSHLFSDEPLFIAETWGALFRSLFTTGIAAILFTTLFYTIFSSLFRENVHQIISSLRHHSRKK